MRPKNILETEGAIRKPNIPPTWPWRFRTWQGNLHQDLDYVAQCSEKQLFTMASNLLTSGKNLEHKKDHDFIRLIASKGSEQITTLFLRTFPSITVRAALSAKHFDQNF